MRIQCSFRALFWRWMGIVLLGWSAYALSQPYPAKPIRMIVSYPPGGPNDIVGRTVGHRLGELIGGSVVIENRSGAGGNIGTEFVAKAAPDGYTLLMAAGAMTIAPSIYPKLGYDVVRDLAPISMTAVSTFVLLVHPAVPARSVKELISLARSRAGMLNFASAGLGAPPHLSAELFRSMTKVSMVHVPYKGATPALAALIGGEVDLYFGGIASAVPHVKSGRLRALGVTSKKRSSALPSLPTLDESGLRGFDISTWFGVMAPAGTAADIIAKLNAATLKAVAAAEVRDTLLAVGFEPQSSTPEQFGAHIKDEIRKFAQIVKVSGAKFE
ncbi:MAG: tripartite tricarboxylate transporter substrate binding protein [Burkholderiales bacterium]|nr:tripartite tricarboxylate transporter substrate binding protein [Burkholderiales bacterium]